jgi:hypothetical protein
LSKLSLQKSFASIFCPRFFVQFFSTALNVESFYFEHFLYLFEKFFKIFLREVFISNVFVYLFERFFKFYFEIGMRMFISQYF